MLTIHKDCGGMGGVVHEEQGAMIATHTENTREQTLIGRWVRLAQKSSRNFPSSDI